MIRSVAVDLTNFQAAPFHCRDKRPAAVRCAPLRPFRSCCHWRRMLASAKYQALLLRRMSSDWLEVKKLNVKALIQGKKVSEDVSLQPGDMIYVPETVLTKVKRYMPYGTGIGVSTPVIRPPSRLSCSP